MQRGAIRHWPFQSKYLEKFEVVEERRNGDFVRTFIQTGKSLACHDCSDGGLLVAIAEMAMAGGMPSMLSTAGLSMRSKNCRA